MPKDPNGNTPFSRRVRNSGFHPYSNHGRGVPQSSSSKDLEDTSPMREWEDVTCPICMEHPHNAVLLLCTSYENGCRPYVCDTSYRHSNCLDQYRKAQSSCKISSPRSFEFFVDSSMATGSRLSSSHSLDGSGSGMGLTGQHTSDGTDSLLERDTDSAAVARGMPTPEVDARNILIRDVNAILPREVSVVASGMSHGAALGGEVTAAVGLQCPLCRGNVKGWKVVQAARMYLNCKVRCCSQEGCSFGGSYEELRKHARSVHPLARPCDVDPDRQLAWRRLERQHDIGDVLSSIQSAMPGALVLGDYVIDGEDGNLLDMEDDNEAFASTGNWWSAFLLFHVFSPLASLERSLANRRVSRRQHSSGIFAMPQLLWGENLVDIAGRAREGQQTSDGVTDGGVGPRRRRRTGRHRSSGGDLP